MSARPAPVPAGPSGRPARAGPAPKENFGTKKRQHLVPAPAAQPGGGLNSSEFIKPGKLTKPGKLKRKEIQQAW